MINFLKLLFIVSVLTFQTNVNASETNKKICRDHYLELIKTNNILKNLKGGEQVHFFLQPTQIVKKYSIDLSQDKLFNQCIQ